MVAAIGSIRRMPFGIRSEQAVLVRLGRESVAGPRVRHLHSLHVCVGLALARLWRRPEYQFEHLDLRPGRRLTDGHGFREGQLSATTPCRAAEEVPSMD